LNKAFCLNPLISLSSKFVGSIVLERMTFGRLTQAVFTVVSLAILVLSVWYYSGFLKKEYAGNFLGFCLASIETAQDSHQKQNIGLALVPHIVHFNSIIHNNPGYWKPIYKLFHTQASLLLLQGRPWDAAEKLKQALRFHPYYPAAYKMLGNIQGILGLDRGKEACYRVHEVIFQSRKPTNDDIQACLNF